MTFPAREVPEENPSRTGWEGTARTPAAGAAEPDAEMDAVADVDTDVQADGEETSAASKVAYAPPLPDAVAGPASGSTAGSGSLAGAGSAMDSGTVADAGPSVDTVGRQRWSQIQAMFVDDPRGSVTQAAAMADEAIEAFIAAARERQAWLASSWQGPDAGTEELRMALRDYRAFWSSMTAIPQPT